MPDPRTPDPNPMNTPILRQEFRFRLKSALIWAAAVVAVIFTYLAFYPPLADEAALLNQAMANFPPAFLQAFGMQHMDWGSIMGFYSFVFLFVQALLAVQASLAGFGLISTDETESIADFLLTRPVTRSQVLASKLLAAFFALTITNAAVWAGSLMALNLFQAGRGYDARAVFLLLGSIVIFQLFFLSVGLFLSLMVRVRSVLSFAMGLALGMYALGALSGILGDVKLGWLSPFAHFEPNRIIETGAYDLPLVMISVAVILLALAGSFWRYRRRDIPAVA